MKRILLIAFLVIGSLLLYFILGLNVVKLILIFVGQALPENIKTNPFGQFIITGILSPIFAALFTYGMTSKYGLQKWSSKSLSKQGANKAIVSTLLVASLLEAVAEFYFIFRS